MRSPAAAPRPRKAVAPATRISVLLVDDHAVVREGIRNLLAHEPGIVVVGEAKDGREAIAMALTLDPDVVLMDIGMPNMNGIEATRQLREVAPRSRVLILSAHSDDHYIESVTALGAVGFILKQASLAELARAIRETGKGGTSVSPVVRKRLLEPAPRPSLRGGPPAGRVPRLSSREAEVLQLVAEGKANKETAAELGISIKTVEKHRQRLMSKLDIHDVAGLTRYAVTAGIVECRTHGSTS
ncbi:MAG: response regulator transcription factor [Planctomycetes bacterium]|nr:response regulator transcription factor [Planctomycetota bacterium]